MAMISAFLRGEGLFARAMRSSAWTIFGFVASQGIRFGSNLILTRLLFPEAFGMMALVTVAMVGLGNFSDIGTGPAIAYNRRGDDPDFLDTAWTLHVIRGVLLWLATCALAWPFARFYGEPMLAQLLPVAGLSLPDRRLPSDPDRDRAPPPELETRDPARPRQPARRHRPDGRPRLVDRLDLVAGGRRRVRHRRQARRWPTCCCRATATAFAGSRRRATSSSTSASGSSSARSAASWSPRATG